MLSTSQNTVLPLEPNTNTITNNSFNAAPGALNSDLLSPVQTRLQAIASSDDFFTRVFGEKANTAEIQAIRSQWAVGDFSIFPKLQIVDAAVMGEAFGAYSQTNQTIYLSDALLANGVDDCMFGATGVLIEETFHWLDSLVGDDTPGDEGELARHLIFGVTPNGEELARIGAEQDQGLLWLNGQATPVEFSTDFAGNTFASARNITLGSTPTTFTDWVGSTDVYDFHQFTLTQASTVDFRLSGLAANADLYLGVVRSLFLDPRSQKLVTLERLAPGAVVGWLGVLRQQACETVMAAEETIGLTIPAGVFRELWQTQPAFRDYFSQAPTTVERAELIRGALAERAELTVKIPLREWVRQLDVKLITLPPGPLVLPEIPECRWWVSLGQVGEYGSQSWVDEPTAPLRVTCFSRLLGVVGAIIPEAPTENIPVPSTPVPMPELPYAPGLAGQAGVGSTRADYPYVRGEGEMGGALACLQMVAKWFQMPFRRELLRRVLESRQQPMGGITQQLMGTVVQLMGMDTQLLQVPSALVTRVEAPALMQWQGQWVVLFAISPQELVLGVPEQGILRRRPSEWVTTVGDEVTLLTLKKTAHTPQARFGLSWFWPSIWRYRRVLLEVLVASFFVQLFSLANPLMIQIIIDKVLVQNSISTLNVLGILLIGVAVAEGVLSALRTYLFVDTTNRMDMGVG